MVANPVILSTVRWTPDLYEWAKAQAEAARMPLNAWLMNAVAGLREAA